MRDLRFSVEGSRRSVRVTLCRDATNSRHDRVQLGLGAGALVTGPDTTASIQFPDSFQHLVDEGAQNEVVPSIAPAADALWSGGRRLYR